MKSTNQTINYLYNDIIELLKDIFGYVSITTKNENNYSINVEGFSNTLNNIKFDINDIIKIKSFNANLTGKFSLYISYNADINDLSIDLILYTKKAFSVKFSISNINKIKQLYSYYQICTTSNKRNTYLYTTSLDMYLLYKRIVCQIEKIINQHIIYMSIYDYYKVNHILDFIHKECTDGDKEYNDILTATIDGHNNEFAEIIVNATSINRKCNIRISICPIAYLKINSIPDGTELCNIKYSFDFKNKVIDIRERDISDLPDYYLIKEMITKTSLNDLIKLT